MRIWIRPAQEEDCLRIAEIGIEGWKFAYGHILPAEVLRQQNIATRAEMIRARLSAKINLVAVNEFDRVQGFIRFVHTCAVTGYDTEIEGLYVDPATGRSGIGKQLLSAALDQVVEAGGQSLYIHTLKENHIGRAFYEKFGGQVVVEDSWNYGNVDYEALGYGWNDLQELQKRLRATSAI